MKNTYKITLLSVFIGVFITIPSVSSALSFVPTERTYYPAGNTQPINIVNNNYNTNVNTNTLPQVAQTPVAPSTYPSANVDAIAKAGLPTLTVEPECTTCSRTSYRMVQQLNCGATIAINNVNLSKPTCSLVPALTASGAIELQWRTAGATVAFIDGGIGHVNTVSGKRIITPTKDTAYNMTVLNDAGIASSCGAKVNVSLAKAGTVNVIANNTNYAYAVNGNNQSASASTATVTGGTVQNTGVNTAIMSTADKDNVSTDVDIKEDITTIEGAESTSILSKIFGDSFKKVALPIGIVFLILIVLLMFIMSKVKGAK